MEPNGYTADVERLTLVDDGWDDPAAVRGTPDADHRLRPGRGDAARRLPRPRLRPRRGARRTSPTWRPTSPGCTAAAASRTRSTWRPARSPTATSPSTRAWSSPPSPTSCVDDQLRDYLARVTLQPSLQPLMAMEEFGAGRVGRDGERGTRRAGPSWERCTARRRARLAERRLPCAAGTRRACVADPGRGQVTLDWEPVEGAAGYLVRRAPTRRRPVRAARDRRAVGAPGPPPAADRHHRRARRGRAGTRSPRSPRSTITTSRRARRSQATPAADGDATCRVDVDAAEVDADRSHRPWRPMIGAERLSQLDHGVGPGGRHDRRRVRRGAADGARRARRAGRPRPRHPPRRPRRRTARSTASRSTTSPASTASTTGSLALGLRPIVEVSFMPRDLAADPRQDRVPLRRDHLAAARTGTRWEALVADAHRPPRRALRPRRGPHLGLRDLERGEPRRVLVRHPRRVLPAVRRQRGAR